MYPKNQPNVGKFAIITPEGSMNAHHLDDPPKKTRIHLGSPPEN